MSGTTMEKGLSARLNATHCTRKKGVFLYTAISVLLVLLGNPLIHWFGLRNIEALAGAITVKAPGVFAGYSLFNLLSFVQGSGVGVLGIPAMLLLILAVGSLVLHLIVLLDFLRGDNASRNLLQLLTRAQAAMMLSLFSGMGTLLFAGFANRKLGVDTFAPSLPVIVSMLLAVTGYVVVMMVQRHERKLYHEHGFIEEFRRNWVLFVFLIPCVLYLIVNNYLPMVGVYFAFTQFNFRDGLFSSPFIGLKNFEFLFKADLLKLTRNTVLYNAVFILIGNAMQVFFAILVSRVLNDKIKKVSQTLIFMPYFVSYVILKVLVYNLFEFDFGILNTYLVNGGFERIDFYNNPSYWPFIITAFYLWKGLGYGMVIYLATIMGISTEYYEAARIDGANVIQEILFVTIPQLKPTFIILLLYSLGSIMKGQFELFYQIIGNNGVLFNVTDILDTYVYRITTTQPLSMGLGTAAGLFQSVFGFVVIMVTNSLIKRKNNEYALF